MGRLARSRMHKNKKDIGKKCKSKRKTKDVDQIHLDLTAAQLKKFVEHEVDHDLPGSGQYYCIHCARYFLDEVTLKHHRKSKIHKRRLKELRETPYSQEEADAVAGLGTYKAPKAVEVADVCVTDLREGDGDKSSKVEDIVANDEEMEGDNE
eukprot:m.15337 g.15337  ORF g.15337 m.15337 type:complete len:152 (+) comp4458_c0_seq1:146-601(+)